MLEERRQNYSYYIVSLNNAFSQNWLSSIFFLFMFNVQRLEGMQEDDFQNLAFHHRL